jgi:hypothetical protein
MRHFRCGYFVLFTRKLKPIMKHGCTSLTFRKKAQCKSSTVTTAFQQYIATHASTIQRGCEICHTNLTVKCLHACINLSMVQSSNSLEKYQKQVVYFGSYDWQTYPDAWPQAATIEFPWLRMAIRFHTTHTHTTTPTPPLNTWFICFHFAILYLYCKNILSKFWQIPEFD